MKSIPFIIILLLVLGACQSTPSGTAMPHPTKTHFSTQTPLPTFTSTPSPTPTIVPTATLSPVTLEQKAGEVCERAFTASVQPGSFQMPYLGMTKLEQDWKNNPPVWKIDNKIPHLYALATDDVQSLLCIHERWKRTGTYTDMTGAYQISLEVRIVAWPDETVLGKNSFTGSPPPQKKTGTGLATGSYPFPELKEWVLSQMPDHPDVLYETADSIGSPYMLDISPTGKTAVVAISPYYVNKKQPTKIRLMDMETLQTLFVVDAHEGRINDVEFSPDGRSLASVGFDGVISFWNANTGELLNSITVPSAPDDITFSPDGRHVAALTRSEIILIDVETNQVSASYSAGGEKVFFSPDGERIYVDTTVLATDTGEIILNFPDPMKLFPTIEPDGSFTFSSPTSAGDFTLAPDGTYGVSFLYGGAPTGQSTEYIHGFSTWDVTTGNHLSETDIISPDFDILGFSPDGQMLAVSVQNDIWLLEAETWQVKVTLSGHTGKIIDLEFTPNGNQIVSSSQDGTIRVWSLSE